MKFDNRRLIYNPPKLLKSLAASIIKLETLTEGKVGHPKSK